MKVLPLWSGLPFAEQLPELACTRIPEPKTTPESLNRINTRAPTAVKKKEVLESEQNFVT
jgi:hypothetical protein